MPAAEAQSLTHLDGRSPVLLDEASSLGYSILGYIGIMEKEMETTIV